MQKGSVQVVPPYKQTDYKQSGWRGAPVLSNGADWGWGGQAIAAKQCRLPAAGEEFFFILIPVFCEQPIAGTCGTWSYEVLGTRS